MNTHSHHAPPGIRNRSTDMADAIVILLSDERHRTTEEIHGFTERNHLSGSVRATRACLSATQFNLSGDQVPYRLRKTKTRPCLWHLQPVTPLKTA